MAAGSKQVRTCSKGGGADGDGGWYDRPELQIIDITIACN